MEGRACFVVFSMSPGRQYGSSNALPVKRVATHERIPRPVHVTRNTVFELFRSNRTFFVNNHHPASRNNDFRAQEFRSRIVVSSDISGPPGDPLFISEQNHRLVEPKINGNATSPVGTFGFGGDGRGYTRSAVCCTTVSRRE